MLNKDDIVVVLEDKVIIEGLKINLESYESRIIYNENIEGLAKCKDIGKDYIEYHKIGEPLSEYVKNNKLSASDIINFIEDIGKILNQFENYLLSENSICMTIDSVLVCNHHLVFMAIPNCLQDFQFELSKFLIRILRYVDVEDKAALSLAYTLFVRSSKDNYTFDDLLEAVEEAQYSKNI